MTSPFSISAPRTPSAPLPPYAAADPRTIGPQPEDFASTLKSARAEFTPEQRARQSAEEFVAQALVFPILKLLRESNQAAAPFAPGPYEKNIGSLFDAETAARIVRARQFPLVDAVENSLLRRPAQTARFDAPLEA